MKRLLEIYVLFFKMSALTFGGGYAMLPLLNREIAQKRNWLNENEILDFYAVSQGLPGIIAVNVSIFIGKKQRGFWGGVSGALGMVSPCLIVITGIAAFLSNFQDLVYVKHAFSGITICVGALIASTVFDLIKKSVKDPLTLFVFVLVFLGVLLLNLNPFIWTLLAAMVGIVFQKIKKVE